MSAAAPTSPSFSVVIPLYNKRGFIRATLQSVLAQTLAPREVIIVDDSSTDGGSEVIADLIGGMVRLVRQDNAGPGPARNRGAALATGEWIALIDADDRWHPAHLANLAGVIAAFPDADVVAAASRWQSMHAIDEALPSTERTEPRRLDYFREYTSTALNSSSIAVRREVWSAAGGFGNFMPGEDVEFWTRLALDHDFAVSPVPTSIYLRDNDGIMDNDVRALRRAPARGASPFDLLVERSLSDARYRERWREIAAFADRAALRSARNALYVGNGRGARGALDRLRGGPSRLSLAYRMASYLPAACLRALAAAYSGGKRAVAAKRARA